MFPFNSIAKKKKKNFPRCEIFQKSRQIMFINFIQFDSAQIPNVDIYQNCDQYNSSVSFNSKEQLSTGHHLVS